jgi:hypothetical protein
LTLRELFIDLKRQNVVCISGDVGQSVKCVLIIYLCLISSLFFLFLFFLSKRHASDDALKSHFHADSVSGKTREMIEDDASETLKEISEKNFVTRSKYGVFVRKRRNARNTPAFSS